MFSSGVFESSAGVFGGVWCGVLVAVGASGCSVGGEVIVGWSASSVFIGCMCFVVGVVCGVCPSSVGVFGVGSAAFVRFGASERNHSFAIWTLVGFAVFPCKTCFNYCYTHA